MLNFGTIFTVVLASLVTSQHGSSLQSNDIEEILELLNRQKYGDVSKQKIEISDSDISSDEDSDNNNIYELLKNMEVIDLIEKANQEKLNPESIKVNKKIHNINNPVYRNFEINRHRNSETHQILEQLLKDKDVAHMKKQKHKPLTPNNLLDSITLNDDDRQEQTDGDVGSLSEYSKIFIVLDPLAIRKSKNKDALTNLVSRILSLSSSTKEKAHRERNKSHRHKGFSVKNNLLSRRYRRDSKETYGGARDSGEDDFKQKRPRSEHAGGSGGRTAIPYIRQRGDIYERDH